MAYAFGRNLLLNSVGFDRLIDAFQQFETGDPASRAQTYPPTTLSNKAKTTMWWKSLWLASNKKTLTSR